VKALRIICANFKEGTPVQLLRDYARFVNMNQMIAASNSFIDITWGITHLMNMIQVTAQVQRAGNAGELAAKNSLKVMAMECTELSSPKKEDLAVGHLRQSTRINKPRERKQKVADLSDIKKRLTEEQISNFAAEDLEKGHLFALKMRKWEGPQDPIDLVLDHLLALQNIDALAVYQLAVPSEEQIPFVGVHGGFLLRCSPLYNVRDIVISNVTQETLLDAFTMRWAQWLFSGGKLDATTTKDWHALIGLQYDESKRIIVCPYIATAKTTSSSRRCGTRSKTTRVPITMRRRRWSTRG
jgi:hypothetical protein